MLSLTLFFTRNSSLGHWINTGLFDRETALYQRLLQRGARVTFVTYGGREELKHAARLPGVRICCNYWGLRRDRYERWIPLLHARALRSSDLIKTNQADGAEIALRAARFWRKPMIARCGYLWARTMIAVHGDGSDAARKAFESERKAFAGAARVVVTTPAMRAYLIEQNRELEEKLRVIPNYVDTERFAPSIARDPQSPPQSPMPRLCFVGRLSPEKNLENLFEAMREIEAELIVIGDGPLREPLEKLAASNPRIRFLGRIPNNDLPEVLRQASAFVFPSIYEGHPKSPLEAMACGLPVIGTDVCGINDIIRHGENGWLCATDAGALRAAIGTVLNDEPLRRRLGEAARRYAVENYSLDRVLELEWALYQEALGGSDSSGVGKPNRSRSMGHVK